MGKRLAYVSTYPNGNYNIYVMPLANGVAGETGDDHERLRVEAADRLLRQLGVTYSSTWTRDGKELIFISNRDNKHGSGGFYRMKAEPGAEMRRFYYEETTWKARPTLSPDGAKLVYSSYLGRQWQQLWAMPSKGGDVFPLTYGDSIARHPVGRRTGLGSRLSQMRPATRAYGCFIGSAARWSAFRWIGRCTRRPMGKLRVRVVDAAGKPLRARVHLNAADGRAYAPKESWFRADWLMFDHMDKSEYHYFHADGELRYRFAAGTGASQRFSRV